MNPRNVWPLPTCSQGWIRMDKSCNNIATISLQYLTILQKYLYNIWQYWNNIVTPPFNNISHQMYSIYFQTFNFCFFSHCRLRSEISARKQDIGGLLLTDRQLDILQQYLYNIWQYWNNIVTPPFNKVSHQKAGYWRPSLNRQAAAHLLWLLNIYLSFKRLLCAIAVV